MLGGNAELIDPCQKFAEVGHRWPQTIFVQGHKYDLPGSGMAYVERAVTALKAAGAKRVEVEPVIGESHVFDLPPDVGTTDLGPKWQAIVKGLELFESVCMSL
jgi:hypothetical protein